MVTFNSIHVGHKTSTCITPSGIVFDGHNAYCVDFPRVSAIVKVTTYYTTIHSIPSFPGHLKDYIPHTLPYKAFYKPQREISSGDREELCAAEWSR